MLPFAAESADAIPEEPGVYVFLGAKGRVLYVGKAVDLRSRVRSYFNQGREFRLVSNVIHGVAESIEFVVTGSEKDALLLENNLIKKHRPRFNIRLTDDKTYFSLRLDPKERWPWFTIVRRRKREAGIYYFGPYTSALACRRTLQFLHTLFPLRSCPDHVLENRTRPCMTHEIGRCAAPCVGLIAEEPYRVLMHQAIDFLRGKNDDVLATLRGRMEEAATKLDFETAAMLRDRIQAIETTTARASVTRRVGKTLDAIGMAVTEDTVIVVVQTIVDGAVAESTTYSFAGYHRPEDFIGHFLIEFYSRGRAIPAEIILPFAAEDSGSVAEVLSDARGAPVDVQVPQRGDKERFIELACRNAELEIARLAGVTDRAREACETLQKTLGLKSVPRRIECFDISNLMGTHVVGSCSALLDGRPDRARYRRYRIKGFDGQDDFAGMAEVLRRRLTRGLAEDDLPDLIVIDGGRAQLEAVLPVFRELEVDDVEVVALAKARSEGRATSSEGTKERVFRPDRELPEILEPGSDSFRLMVSVRDEAHRFAIGYHRNLRGKAQTQSSLELVKGIGRSRARALLKRFGSVKGVLAAPDSDLLLVAGMTPRQIEALRVFYAEGGIQRADDPVIEFDDTIRDPNDAPD